MVNLLDNLINQTIRVLSLKSKKPRCDELNKQFVFNSIYSFWRCNMWIYIIIGPDVLELLLTSSASRSSLARDNSFAFRFEEIFSRSDLFLS